MRATIIHAPHDIRVEEVPDPTIDLTVGIDGVSDGYRAMDERTALKVLIKP